MQCRDWEGAQWPGSQRGWPGRRSEAAGWQPPASTVSVLLLVQHRSLLLIHSTTVISSKQHPMGGGPLVISHKCRLICWLILAPRPHMHFLHKTFPGTTDKTYHCAKFHSSSCLFSWMPKTDLCETTGCSPHLLSIIGKHCDSEESQQFEATQDISKNCKFNKDKLPVTTWEKNNLLHVHCLWKRIYI